MPVKKLHDAAVIGAGISGLCAARSYYHSSGRTSPGLHVFEKSNQVGGASQTHIKNGYLAETGPNSLLIKDKRVDQLLNNIGLEDNDILIAASQSKKRYIAHNGSPHALPASIKQFLSSPLFSTKGKLRLCIEPLIRKPELSTEESFAQFVTRRLGIDILETAAEPFVNGIYAGDAAKLSVKHAFPQLHKIEQQYGSVFIGLIAKQLGFNKLPHAHRPSKVLSFRTGMQHLPQAISSTLPKGALKLQTTILSIERTNQYWQIKWSDASGNQHTESYKKLVLAIPHHQLNTAPLPESLLSTLSPLSNIQSPPVTSLTLGFKRDQIKHALDGFGMLIKKSEQSPLLGVIFSSSMFAERAPEGHVTLTCMMGGAIHPEYAENTEDTVLKELDRLLGVNGKPTFSHRTSWRHAIPQYNIGYQSVEDAISKCETQNPGFHILANYRSGISLSDCIINGLDLGKKLFTE